MSSCEETSTLEHIRQHLLTDFASMESLLCTSPQTPQSQKASTLSQRRPSINVTIPSSKAAIETFETAIEAVFKLRGSKAILNFPLQAGKSNDDVFELTDDSFLKKRKREQEEESVESKVLKKEEVTVTENVTTTGICLTPSNWMGFWDSEDMKRIFSVSPLSPLSPRVSFGYSISGLAVM